MASETLRCVRNPFHLIIQSKVRLVIHALPAQKAGLHVGPSHDFDDEAMAGAAL